MQIQMIPRVLHVQYYRPELEELHEWVEADISTPDGVGAIDGLPRDSMLRVRFTGEAGSMQLSTQSEPGRNWYEFSGADEIYVWEDDEYLYVASIIEPANPGQCEVISYCMVAGNKCGLPSRLRLSHEEWSRMYPTKPSEPFVGVLVPSEHAVKLGLEG